MTAVASYSGLPEPMLARSGRLPTSGDYAYEVKWAGFRAIVSTEGPLRMRSRRGWDMTARVADHSERIRGRPRRGGRPRALDWLRLG